MSFMTDCYGTSNPKLHFDLLLFHLAQGLTGSQKILPVTLKISIFYLTYLKVAAETKFVPYSLFKS